MPTYSSRANPRTRGRRPTPASRERRASYTGRGVDPVASPGRRRDARAPGGRSRRRRARRRLRHPGRSRSQPRASTSSGSRAAPIRAAPRAAAGDPAGRQLHALLEPQRAHERGSLGARRELGCDIRHQTVAERRRPPRRARRSRRRPSARGSGRRRQHRARGRSAARERGGLPRRRASKTSSTGRAAGAPPALGDGAAARECLDAAVLAAPAERALPDRPRCGRPRRPCLGRRATARLRRRSRRRCRCRGSGRPSSPIRRAARRRRRRRP